jgi:hypothetical protein
MNAKTREIFNFLRTSAQFHAVGAMRRNSQNGFSSGLMKKDMHTNPIRPAT